MQQKSSKGWFGNLAPLLFFLIVLVFLALATLRLGGSTNDEGVRATQEAIERAAVLCYATEGFYPPGIHYIEENYGVQIDHSRYMVQYDIMAPKIRPSVTVNKK